MWLNEFKNFDANRLSLEELVSLSAFGTALRQEYETLQLDEPDFLDSQLKSLKREIRTRNADRLEKSLREKRARLETLKTPTQRKTELQKEIKELENQLAEVG
jgi:hypothetical protein